MMPTNPCVSVTIEVPRGAFIKRDAHGQVDLVSPVPAPFNYGRIEGVVGGDGEPQDAIVLGARLPRGHVVQLPVQAVVRFVDRGQRDDKWVCSPSTPTRFERRAVIGFFGVYAQLKRLRDRLSLQPARSAFEGWRPASAGPPG